MTTSADTPAESRTRTASVVLLGADAVLAAHPATAVQLAHACMRAGYSAVVPPSWGDELIAAQTMRALHDHDAHPVVHCACPRVSARLLDVGDDLAPFLLMLVPPPVAAAHYLRALPGGRALRITFVGACPAGTDPVIDEQVAPGAFLAMLAQRGIALADQPTVFEDVLPPDRRRHRSLPGGVPAPEALCAVEGGWPLIEIDGEEPLTDLAQHLACGERKLLDLAPMLGCACSGAVAPTHPRAARDAVTAVEPPRSGTDVVDLGVPVPLARAAPRVEREPAPAAPAEPPPSRPHVEGREEPAASTPDTEPAAEAGGRAAARPRQGARGSRTFGGASRGPGASGGRPLPRAYIARRATARRPDVGSGSAIGAPQAEAETIVRREPAPRPEQARADVGASGARNGASHHADAAAREGEEIGETEVVRHAPQTRLFAAVPIAAARSGEAPRESPQPRAVEESRRPSGPVAESGVLPEVREALVNIVGMLGVSLGTLADLLLDPQAGGKAAAAEAKPADREPQAELPEG